MNKKFIVMLVAPWILGISLGHYSTKFLSDQMESYLSVEEGKETVRIPDLHFIRSQLVEEALSVLSYIPIKFNAEGDKHTEEKITGKPPQYKLTFTYTGSKKRYTIINGMLFKEGDMVSPDERIIKITREGVLLSGKWGKRWLYIGE